MRYCEGGLLTFYCTPTARLAGIHYTVLDGSITFHILVRQTTFLIGHVQYLLYASSSTAICG